MGQHPKHAHHHAKAVVEGDGNANPVRRREGLPGPNLGAVVQDIEMGEGRALGIACGAAGELNIDGIIGAQGRREGGEPSALPCPTQGADRGEVQHARRCVLAEANDDFELGKLRALERPRGAVRELRRKRFQHAEVVAGLKALRGNNGLTADLGEGVL